MPRKVFDWLSEKTMAYFYSFSILFFIASFSIVVAQNQTHKCVAKILPCANLGKDCKRHSSVFFLKIRGSGGKMFGEGVLNHIFERENMIIAEGNSMAHVPTLTKLENLERLGNVIRITILRNPIERALSRYWFEGRWQLFVKDRSEDTAMPFHMWVDRDNCGPGKERSGRLWNCMENYYVKTFSGWTGQSMCNEQVDGCVGGVSDIQVVEAMSVLSNRFDIVLISEWLSSRPQIRLLSKLLCFDIDEVTGALPLLTLGLPKSQLREVPSFKPKRPAGGHSKERPVDWMPSTQELDQLVGMNQFDLGLYHWAEDKMRQRLKAGVNNKQHEIDELPESRFIATAKKSSRYR